VYLQSNKTHYPVLTDSAGCSIIRFAPGAELARQDLLVYDSAKVDLTLETHRWYMLSAPLQNFYAGDFYLTDPNPHADKHLIEPMLFNINNPQTNDDDLNCGWSGIFNTAEHLFGTGQGFALWINDTDAKYYSEQKKVTFSFPKTDSYYWYYSPETHAPTKQSADLNRENSHKLAVDREETQFTVSADFGQSFMVGNPFMAHLDFYKFREDNKGDINNEYKLASDRRTTPADSGKVNDIYTYKFKDGNIYSTDPTGTGIDVSGYITPMQSFIVTPVSTGTDPLNLTAKTSATVTDPGNNLRSGTASDALVMLEIYAGRGRQLSKALLLYSEEASANYRAGEDSRKLFSVSSLDPVLVYMRSGDGYALDINSIGELTGQVALGIRTAQAGAITLRFAGVDAFEGKKVYLHDTEGNSTIDLSRQSEYTFTKYDTEGLYLENRFFLSFEDATALQAPNYPSISISRNPLGIHVLSNDGSPLENVRVFDLQGRRLSDVDPSSSSYSYKPPVPGIYIVQARNAKGVTTGKVEN
jgi:hypothetical protein